MPFLSSEWDARVQQGRGRLLLPRFGRSNWALERPPLANMFVVVQAWRISDGDAGTVSVPIEVAYQGEF